MRFILLTTSFKRFICVSIICFSFVVSVQAQGTDPVISSFSPLTGNAGETVIITGNNFNTTASNNIVFFGATKAIVSAATATSLTVTVPSGATFGALTLVDLSINKTINSKKFFTPTFSPSKGILTAADFSTEQEFSTGETEPSKIAATGDLDGDGKPDIIIADGSGTNTMLILRNTGGSGTASFETALTMNTGGYNISLAVGDIDADGKLDIVEVNYNNNSDVKVYLNTTIAVGSISFADPINLPTGAAQYKLRNVAISDLDGDGKADLAVVDNSGSVLLFRNTGSVGVVGFDTKVVLDAGTGPQGIRIGDIDSDGLADLAITNADGGGTSVRVLRNTSTSGSFSFVNSGNFTTGGGPYDLALGDLDGDGELDIATVNHSGQNVSVLLNTSTSGTVSFANKTDFAIGKSTLKIAIGDLNGDGKLDVVVTQSGAAVFILMNTTTTLGTVTFDPKIDIASTGTSLQAMILDLDGDGKTDFATGGSKKIVVFSNADPLENADLGALSISETTLSPTFTPTNMAYSATVSNAITSITVTPTQTQSNEIATIQVSVNAGSYSGVTSAAASGDLALNVGANTIDVKVTSPDGTTIKIYGITVTRELPVPSYIVSGAGTAEVNGLYVHIGKNSSDKELWQFGSYYLASNGSSSWIGNDPNSTMSGAQYYDRDARNKPSPLDWNMSSYFGSSPNPIIELAAPKVTYASSTFIENSTNGGAITATTTITHNNYESATFTGTDSEDFVASGKAIATGVPAGLTAVITRDNDLQLTFSLTGNASAHANDINNLNITFQDAAFSDSDAVNTTNFSTNFSINFIEQINVGSGETYTTIQSAVDAAGNGDVLLLAAETFTEQNITIANKSLTIIGVSPASTIVQAHAAAGSATDRVFNITHSSYAETNQNTFEKLTIRHGNVANSNNRDRGGALFASNTTLKLKDCAIESNRVGTTSWGGYGVGGAGVFVELSNFISENSTYYDNHHTSQSRSDMMGGGAIAFFTDDTKPNYMKVTNSTFSGNTSGNFGGAIFTRRRPAALNDISITNSTFVGNSASYGGGYSSMGSSANTQPTYLTNSLFYGNTASLGGSQMYSNETTAWTVNNCLIEDISAGNLEGVYTDCIVGEDPLLGTLTDNGGFTKTISIVADSPAINTGTTTSLLLDQRGFSIVGNRDIGAYEYGGAIPLSSNAELSDLTTTAGVLSPTFAKGTIAYTANVNSSITSITVTPTQSDANATIEVQANGSGYATVTTATASSALALSIGANTVDVKVTAEDGSASKTYTITITVTNTPPTFTSTAITSVNQGDTYSYAITTNDVDGNAVSVTATTKPSWLTINSNVEVSTFAGANSGFHGGTGINKSSSFPQGVASDPSGNVYVADSENHKIWKITPAGVVSTLAGSYQGDYGDADGTGRTAQFDTPHGVAVDASGNVYVADTYNYKIRKITPAGVVSTFAGSSSGFADGTGTAAKFSVPSGVAVDASGNVYVADTRNQKIRKITPAGVVSTLAGASRGFADGTGTAAKFSGPQGVTVDTSGNVYVADSGNSKIRKITPSGVVTTFAGSDEGDVDGTGTAAKFYEPDGIAVDASGNVYVADQRIHKIRKITPVGVVSTLAGSYNEVGFYDDGGYLDGNGTTAKFKAPTGVAVDASGNLYVGDSYNGKIRKITTTGAILSGDTTGQVGDHNVVLDATDGNGGTVQQIFTIDIVSKPTITASAASTITASGAALNSNVTANGGATVTERGFVYAETSNDATPTLAEVNGTTVIKEVVTGTTGAFTKVLTGLSVNTGFSYVSYAINSIGTTESSIETFTTINTPPTFTTTAVTSVNQGDTYSYTITTNDVDGDAVSVTATTKPSWLTIHTNVEVSTFAGASRGFADGTGTAAQFNSPVNVALDPSGNVYVADYGNHKIRKITPAGVVSTFAGSSAGFADGTGTSAQFNRPSNVALDASGNVYVADTYNHKIRKITPAGVVSTFAGASEGFADGTGTAAQFKDPVGVTVDTSGNVYVADSYNHKIRKITPAGVVSTFAGSGDGFADGTGTSAQFKLPAGVAVDASENVYVADLGNHKIRKITPTGVVSTFAGSTEGDADGNGTTARFKYPRGVAVDASGNVYVADTYNSKIRKITPAGVVSTLAGSSEGFADGNGTTAQFSYPTGVAVDTSGNLYVADTNNSKIRKITTTGAILSGDTTGQVGDHNVVLDATDGNGGTVQQIFTIDIVVPVLSKNGEISFTNPNYVNKNGAVNTIFGLSATGAVIAVKDPPPPAIGDLREGGIVFWVDGNGGGLVCALSDYATPVEWGCNVTDLVGLPNVPYNEGNPVGPGAGIGDGEANTNAILADCPTASAALAARTQGSDWFLPSVNELNEMYIHKTTLEAVDGFAPFSSVYWSSTENGFNNAWNNAWLQFFNDGIQDKYPKDYGNFVRAVRAF